MRHPFFAALVVTGLFAAGCNNASETTTQGSGSAEVSNKVTEKAKVVAIDKAKRVITLKDKDGITQDVQAGPEVKNFDQIAVGDSVVVDYLQSLAVELVKPGQATPPSSAAVVAGSAEKGAKPGALLGGQVTATVRIESVDLKKNLVVFTPPTGGMRAVHVQRPEGVKFIQGLKTGDQVQITWTEAIAISLEKE
jgi:hypothetical protein